MDRIEMNLSIYSGEYIPLFFSYKGFPNRLEIQLCEKVNWNQYYTENVNKHYILKFPKIMEVKVDIKKQELKIKVQTLCNVCSFIQKNIAAKVSQEYIFEIDSDPRVKVKNVLILAGQGSVKVFRDNFLKRLAEILYNLQWIYKNCRSDFNEEEFKIFEKLFHQLADLDKFTPLPDYLKDPFESLKTLISGNAKENT